MSSASGVAIAALVLSIMIFASFVSSGSAATRYYTPLKTGDSAYYAISGNYGYIPSEPVTQMKILSVSGTNVTASFTNFFPDGHISPNFWIDVFWGTRYNLTSTFFFAVASGLHVGDQIFNTWSNITIIAQQTTTCGAGATRLAVGAQFISQSGQQVNTVWDQQTGALCGYSASDFQSGKTIGLNMVNNTIWGQSANLVPSDPFTVGAEISALLGLPTVAILLFVYFRKKRTRGIPR